MEASVASALWPGGASGGTPGGAGGEFFIMVIVHRTYILLHDNASWNTFVFILILIAAMEQAVLPLIRTNDKEASVIVSVLRTMRLCKVWKIMRMFQALQFVSELSLLMVCLLYCGISLFWAVLMLGLMLLLFSLLIVQAVTGYLMENIGKLDETLESELRSSFGVVEDTMVVLFQSVSGGKDWGHYYDILHKTGPLHSFMFLMFILTFVMAVWNIVTSLFIGGPMDLVRPDIESLMLTKRRQDTKDAKELMEPCQQADSDKSDSITLDEP